MKEQGVNPNIVSWMAQLGACRTHWDDNLERAKRIYSIIQALPSDQCARDELTAATVLVSNIVSSTRLAGAHRIRHCDVCRVAESPRRQ